MKQLWYKDQRCVLLLQTRFKFNLLIRECVQFDMRAKKISLNLFCECPVSRSLWDEICIYHIFKKEKKNVSITSFDIMPYTLFYKITNEARGRYKK